MIHYSTNLLGIDTKVQVTQEVRKDGAVNVNINSMSEDEFGYNTERVTVTAHMPNPAEQMALFFATDALRRHYPLAKFFLIIPYLPYARQDRVCNDGESHNLKVFCDMVNNLKYDVVQVFDPHSIVATGLLNNVSVVDQYELFGDIKTSWREVTIVAPDAGATKKCEAFAKRVGAAGVITCHKTRDMKSGDIIDMTLNHPVVNGMNYLILDDICDGGRTFIEVAKMFSGLPKSKVELAVTHGIFSYGVDIVAEHFDHVYTTNSFRNDLVENDKLTVIEI